MLKNMKGAWVLCLITLMVGLILGFVYELTKEPRRNQELRAKEEAYRSVFSAAERFTEQDFDGDGLAKVLAEQDISDSAVTVDAIAAAEGEDGALLGYAVTVTAHEGYGGDIVFTVGIDLEGRCTGISMLTISETPGLGMKAAGEDFLAQYEGDAPSVYYITGKDPEAEAGAGIDAISGATITSRAVTKGVNAALFAAAYMKGGEE